MMTRSTPMRLRWFMQEIAVVLKIRWTKWNSWIHERIYIYIYRSLSSGRVRGKKHVIHFPQSRGASSLPLKPRFQIQIFARTRSQVEGRQGCFSTTGTIPLSIQNEVGADASNFVKLKLPLETCDTRNNKNKQGLGPCGWLLPQLSWHFQHFAQIFLLNFQTFKLDWRMWPMKILWPVSYFAHKVNLLAELDASNIEKRCRCSRTKSLRRLPLPCFVEIHDFHKSKTTKPWR